MTWTTSLKVPYATLQVLPVANSKVFLATETASFQASCSMLSMPRSDMLHKLELHVRYMSLPIKTTAAKAITSCFGRLCIHASTSVLLAKFAEFD
jgi:hypothetical protein